MKIPTVDFTDETLAIHMEMMLEVVIGVLVMEVDKVADEVTTAGGEGEVSKN